MDLTDLHDFRGIPFRAAIAVLEKSDEEYVHIHSPPCVEARSQGGTCCCTPFRLDQIGYRDIEATANRYNTWWREMVLH